MVDLARPHVVQPLANLHQDFAQDFRIALPLSSGTDPDLTRSTAATRHRGGIVVGSIIRCETLAIYLARVEHLLCQALGPQLDV